MPKIIPDLDSMLKQAGDHLKREPKDILREIQDVGMKRYHDLESMGMGLSEIAYLYLQQLGINFLGIPVKDGEIIYSDDIVGKQNVTMRGYVCNIWRGKTKTKNTDYIGFELLDEKGIVGCRVYGPTKIKEFDEKKIVVGDAIKIINAQPFQNPTNNSWTATISGTVTELIKVNPSEVKLPLIETLGKKKIVELRQRQMSTINGVVLDIKERSYLGCPICLKKPENPVAQGQSFLCAKCNTTRTSTKLFWTNVLISDGSGGQIYAVFNPSLKPNKEEIKGKVLTLIGSMDDKSEFHVTLFKVNGSVEIPQSNPSEPQVIATGVATVELKPATTSSVILSLSLTDEQLTTFKNETLRLFGTLEISQIKSLLQSKFNGNDSDAIVARYQQLGLMEPYVANGKAMIRIK